jgi:hypothetical protein
MELESPDEGAALGDAPTQEQSGPSSSDTAKQSEKLAYWRHGKSKTPSRHAELAGDNLLHLRVPRSVDWLTEDSASTPHSRRSRIVLESFKLERVVPAAEGRVTHGGSGVNELISILNKPFEIKAILCTFNLNTGGRSIDGVQRAHRDEDILDGIDAIGKCQSLEKLTIVGELELEHLKRLCQSVQTSKVGHLELRLNIHDEEVTTVCKMVESNHNLKHLTFAGLIDRSEDLRMSVNNMLSFKDDFFQSMSANDMFSFEDDSFESMLPRHPMKASVGASLGSMLAKNSTLEHLDLGDSTMSPSAIKALLRPLTGDQRQLPVNTSLKHISVPSASEDTIGHRVARAVAAMLTSNKTLTHLNLAGYVFSEPSDACMVLQSLRTNETLQTLDMVGCCSHFEWEKDVFSEMLLLTQANLFLKSIELSTAQFGEGYIEAVKAQLAANAIKRSGTNVENLRETALHNPMMPQFSVEIEVPQEILESKRSESLQTGLDNLEVSACKSKSITRLLDFEIAIKVNQFKL